MVLLVGLTSLSGCGAPDAGAGPIEATPGAWAPELEDLGAASTADAVEARMQQAIAAARSFHASPIVAGYQAAVVEATEACPTWYGIGEFQYWYDTCTTDGGATFDGYVFEQPATDTIDYTWTGMRIWGAASITTADGRLMHVGGRVESTSATGQGTTMWHSRAEGSFQWDGAEADGTWLGEGYDLDLDTIGSLLADGSDGRALNLDGGIYGFAEPLATVRFEALSTLRACSTCDLEPTGMISVRDTDGRWYQVEFGAQDEPSCGTLTMEGAELGQVCLDFTPLVDWDDGGPW